MGEFSRRSALLPGCVMHMQCQRPCLERSKYLYENKTLMRSIRGRGQMTTSGRGILSQCTDGGSQNVLLAFVVSRLGRDVRLCFFRRFPLFVLLKEKTPSNK